MAVHAVGGRRDQYRPLRSLWQASPSPIALGAALRAELGLDRIYLADLDAIAGHPPNREVYQGLAAEGLEVWLDAGVRDRQTLSPLEEGLEGRLRVVLGLESLGGPEALGRIVERLGSDRVVFSLDLDEGRPRIAPGAEWSSLEGLSTASQAIDRGIRSLILLDLARVGTDRGIGAETLLQQIVARSPDVDVGVGGGVRGIVDVLRLRELGASSVLVGSAIHDGRIGRRELERIGREPGRSG
jgi:phosphoribosylformimino-5-aminoimidazole carboxamide ribotide isomerase